MSAVFENLTVELRAVVAAAWPDTTADGIWENEDLMEVPFEKVVLPVANIAVQFLNGETPKAEMSLYDTPSQLFVPAVVTRENLKAEIIDKHINTAAELCVDRYAAGCAELGIK